MAKSKEDDVRLFLVLPSDSEDEHPSECLQRCYQKVKEIDLNSIWIKEKECLQLNPTKRDVFVFESFEGAAFDCLSKTKCTIVGPRCLLTSLTDGIELPSSPSPMFTSAMRNLVVTASGCGVEKKNHVKKLVGLMGGVYTSNLCVATTHLIVSHVKSTKYERAVENGTKVMTVNWVEAVWEASLKENVHGNDQQFECHKCPVFLGLIVCSSKLPPREAKKVEKLVNENGGKYIPSLSVEVGLLVVRKPIGEKFKYARQWNIPCISDQWIFDSIQKGQALPTKAYEIHGTGASTPTRDEEFVDFSNMSVMSNVVADNRTHINETIMNDTCTSSISFQVPRGPTTPVKMQNIGTKTPVKDNPRAPGPSELKVLLDQMDLTKLKAAGSFLDGCGVYLSGWDAKEEEKLRRILKGSGVARFSELSDSVTHVLVGDLNPTVSRWHKNNGQRTHVVNIKWLIESIAQRRPAAEELYTCFNSNVQINVEPPSPLSKKGLALLSGNAVTQDPLPAQLNANQEDTAKNALLKAYQDADNNVRGSDRISLYRNPPNGGLSDSVAMPPPANLASKAVTNSAASTSVDCTTDESRSSQLEEVMVFQDLSFIVVGHSDEFTEKIESELIQAYGGEVVPKSFKGIPDYAIVPLQGAALRHTTNEIVTAIWLEDCIQQQQLLSVQYYHQPVVTQTEKKPLTGLVLGISGYMGQERSFLSQLATVLGAEVQDVFAKKNKENVKASSHLICAAMDNGSKYTAAMKWGLPAVYHSWILACASSSSRVPEQQYLVNPNQNISPSEKMQSLPSSDSKDNGTAFQTPVRPENPQDASLGDLSDYHTPDDSPYQCDMDKLNELINRPIPPNPFAVKTPEVLFGCSDNPTKEECKKWQRWLDRLPEKQPTPVPRKRRDSTPMAEIKRRIWRAAGVFTPEPESKNGEQDANAGNGVETEIQQAAKRQRLGDDSKDTPKAFTKSPDGKMSDSSKLQPRQLFDHKSKCTESPIEGQINNLNKLLKMTETERERPASTIGLHMSSTVTSNKHTESLGKASLPHKEVLKVEASQPYEIRWEDPVDACRGKKEVTPVKECPPIKKYVFMLSNVENRSDLALIVQKLNGVLSELSNFDPDATHLILDKPARSEKLLAAISSGKWVLHSSYLEQSLKKSMFLPEEDFEWGNPKNSKLLALLDHNSMEYDLARSAFRWRMKLNNNPGSGAFSGMRCVMYTSKEKSISMSRVITAGHGEILPESERENATICLIEISKLNVLPKQIDHQDLQYFADQNIPCVPLLYISDYLTKDPPPSPSEKLIQF